MLGCKENCILSFPYPTREDRTRVKYKSLLIYDLCPSVGIFQQKQFCFYTYKRGSEEMKNSPLSMSVLIDGQNSGYFQRIHLYSVLILEEVTILFDSAYFLLSVFVSLEFSNPPLFFFFFPLNGNKFCLVSLKSLITKVNLGTPVAIATMPILTICTPS